MYYLFIFRTIFVTCLLACYSCTNECPSENEKTPSSGQRLAAYSGGSNNYGGRPLSRTYSVLSEAQAYSQYASQIDTASVSLAEGCNDDVACLTMAAHDRHGLEAIRSLHRQLDDDANGAVDLSESDDFLREELQYENGAEKRQKAFHRNDDMQISVKELWEAWLRSEVHNWTVEQTTEWLASSVELPQYVPIFILNRVTGATLPRLAVSNMHYLSNVLGIKDPIHKQKIALKAMDVVLFGPPKEYNHHIKDLILLTLLFGALIGCWYAYRQNKNSRRHLRRMMKDMESLHKAELALENLQKELERARQEQEYATTEKQDLERRLQEQRTDATELKTSYSDLEVSQLKAEIELLRQELQRAEGELEDRCWSPPVGLQQWMQLTHEIENKAYVKKKLSAEKQLQQAREACEKLRKKRSSLVGAFVSTHGKSIDDVDRSIVEARTSLNEVTQELAERVHRWKQIEMMCGFNIVNNSGLAVLESILYRGAPNGRALGLRGRMSSQDDLDDDASSYAPSAERGVFESVSRWQEGVPDSSGSEKQDQDDEDSRSNANVQFTLGGDQDETTSVKSQTTEVHSQIARKKTPFPRSYSQDVMPLDSESGPRSSNSETNLASHGVRLRGLPLRTAAESASVDEETYSTDSNSTAAEDGSTASDKKRSKLRFPKFVRKSRLSPLPPQVLTEPVVSKPL